MVSNLMKERLLQVRLKDLAHKLRIISNFSPEAIQSLLSEYAKDVRLAFNDEEQFNDWCKDALGAYPEEILEEREEKSQQEIADWINKRIDEAIEILEKKGIKINVL